jgi:hypothetical protein
MTRATKQPPRRVIRYRRPPVYAKQRDFLDCVERYVIVEASTKTGKTVAMLIWLLEQAMQGRSGWNYWWVAPVYPQAKIAYRRLRRWLRQRSIATGVELARSNETELTITLANGTVIWFKTAEKPDNLYGEDVHAAVIDEATRCREESWIAIRSTLTATGGRIRIIGNVKGSKNWAFRLARRAEGGEPNMRHFRLTAYDAAAGLADLKHAGRIPATTKVITLEDIEDAKRQLPEAAFQELFLAVPSDDGSNPFGLEHIRTCIRMHQDLFGDALSPAPAVHFGWDLAKKQDWTVGTGLDREGHVAAWERFQASWDSTIARVKETTGKRPAIVDATGVGDPIVELLQKEGGQNFEGYVFSPQSKQRLMEGLSVAIQRHEVTFPDGVIRNELEVFEFEYTRTGVRYSAPEGQHDDAVMSLALAVAARNKPGQGQAFIDAWSRMAEKGREAIRPELPAARIA